GNWAPSYLQWREMLGLLGLHISPQEELELVTAVQGSSFSTTCYYDNDKYSLEEKFWCKMLSDLECNSRIFLSIRAKGGKYLNIAPKRRVNLTNSGTGWISVSMTELRIEDSGTYFCGVFDHQTIIPLKKIKMTVSYDDIETPYVAYTYMYVFRCTLITYLCKKKSWLGMYFSPPPAHLTPTPQIILTKKPQTNIFSLFVKTMKTKRFGLKTQKNSVFNCSIKTLFFLNEN
uniref:Immunoglobulin V-set domain-containing protein n=1 Tax=Terrapene triunguis TaxID=2587831 RepID=A0A674K1W8_9SAUR